MEAVANLQSKAKFCVDCEHIAGNSSSDWERFKCRAKQNELSRDLNLVTGHDIVRWKVDTCKECRESEAHCGKSAVWYEKRTFKITNLPLKKEDAKSKADEL